MLHYACLFAHDQPSTPQSDWDIDHGRVDGWAEWFERVPLLFLYLIGDARHLPECAPCAIYGDGGDLACLVAPMEEVRERWLALDGYMRPHVRHMPDEARAQWAQMHATITGTSRHWLVLDCSALISASVGTPEMDAFLQGLRQRCAEWELAQETGVLPPVLQALLNEAAGQWGWWGPGVIERIYEVEERPYEEWPAALRERYEPANNWPWEEEVQAYRVRPIDRSADESSPDGSDERCGPVGLVTPYGRWLVHPDEGTYRVYVDKDRIVARRRGAWDDGIPTGFKDLNGQWLVPFSAGFLNMSRVTPTLALGRRTPPPAGLGRRVGLLRWPGGELLFDDLETAWLHEDGWVRIAHADETESVLDATTGEPVFAARYRNIFAFHKKLRLAVVEQCRPAILQGVVHESGRLVIPCDYAHIHHAYKQPPKLLQGRQLLAITPDGQPHFYGVDGKLLAALDCDVKPWTWTPIIKNNQLLAFDRPGMDSQLIWISLSDYGVTVSGETRAEYVEMVKEGFGDWLPR